jgi:integrase
LTAYFPDLIDHLQEYLTLFRPRFPNASTSPYVFLTRSGAPFNPCTFWEDFTMLVLKRTGKRCYPHLLRTLWVSEFFTDGGKPATAAYMLNDTVQTALLRYQEFMDANHLQEASSFNQKLGK